MKILQVTPAFPPSALGGISTHVGLLSKGLASLGHKVKVATTNRYDSKSVMPFSGLVREAGAQIFYAKAYWPGRYFFAPQVVGVIRAWAAEADIVHVHDTRTFVGLAAYLAAKNLSIPYVLTCHGSLSTRVGSTLLKVLHDRMVGKGLVRRASRIIALTEQEVSTIAQFGISRDRIVIVPNAIPLADPVGDSTPPENAPHVKKTILYLGRIHAIKGIDRLIDAFALVARRNQDCRLLVVGQDYGAQRSLTTRVKRHQLGGRVEFPGPKYGMEKDQLLKAADVLVLPSYKEAFPLVVLEAFAAGLPVVATSGCDIATDLKSNNAALIVSSTVEMASAIESCLYEPPVVRQLRSNGLRLLQTTYNWDRVLNQISRVYGDVTG